MGRCTRAHLGVRRASVDEMRQRLTQPGTDPALDTWVVQRQDSEIAGFAQVWSEPPHAEVVCYVRVDPDSVGQGIGSALLERGSEQLISNSWTKTNLLNAMFPTSNPPQIASINAHYDHYRSLPADENAAHRESILYTTADLAGRSTNGRVIFTMGCHSVLPVSDFVFADVLKNDWVQAYAQIGAVVYMGNTGFGIGDTAAVCTRRS
jgi:hypothetical protein